MPIRVGRGGAGSAPLVTRLVPCWLALACLLLAGCHPDLFAAARQSRQQAALVEMFPDPQAQALAIAAEHGDAREVGRLMREEGVDPDRIFSSPKGRIPLLAWPIITGNPDGLRAMLEAGADPNAKTRYPSDRGERYYPNAMVWAAQQPDPAYLRILLDHGGDPDTRNANDEALLFHAYIHGNQWRNVQLLVERGADVNADVSVGRTILNLYASRGGFETALWLLERGADPSLEYEQQIPVSKNDSHAIEAIYWHPGELENSGWQQKCQAHLAAKGFGRPPIPEHYRAMRELLGLASNQDLLPGH